MLEEQPKTLETQSPSEPPPPPPHEAPPPPQPTPPYEETPLPQPPPPHEERPKDVTEEKYVTPQPPYDDLKALTLVEKLQEATEEKPSEGSANRVLARVATEKRLSLIKAWEESEKSKAEDNGAHKKLSAISAWENSKKAAIEAELRKIKEQFEKKKAEYEEKMKNKIAMIHKEAQEKRAIIDAKKGEDLLKAEEAAAKYRATGTASKKILGCF